MNFATVGDDSNLVQDESSEEDYDYFDEIHVREFERIKRHDYKMKQRKRLAKSKKEEDLAGKASNAWKGMIIEGRKLNLI